MDRSGVSDTAILIVNQEHENNNVDQFMLSLHLMQAYHIPCVWQTHGQLRASMVCEAGRLRVQGKEIAVVYYRSAYTPADYPSEAEWAVREQVELSRAIKVSAWRCVERSVRTSCCTSSAARRCSSSSVGPACWRSCSRATAPRRRSCGSASCPCTRRTR